MGVRELSTSQFEFFEACRRGDLEKVKCYIASKKGKKPRTPLNFLRPATPSAGWLVACKDPSTFYTPLHYAALHGHHHISKVLIESDRLLPSARDKRGCVPLHLAAWNGHFEAVKLLAESDPDSVDAVNNAQESSLHLAAQHGHDKLVRVLLEHHADPRLRNARFETPLDVAARTGHAVVCKILIGFCPELALQSAVDCSSTGENGRIRAQVVYPLHAAARHSHIQCLQILRLGGFDINFVTDEGSALHVAAMFGQVDAVKYLTDEGINPHMRDSKGKTALEVLRDHEQHRTSDLTYIIQSREGWSECRRIIDGYIQRLKSDHFNSSSDSGIDRRDSERSAVDDDVNIEIWRPLPHNSNANSPRKPSDDSGEGASSPTYKAAFDQISLTAAAVTCDSAMIVPEESKESSFEEVSIATVCSLPSGAPIHRTWNSRMYDAERGIARFPITSPMNKTRHQKSKRTSDTLPLNFSGIRTGGVQQRGSILPSDPQNCVYRAPPVFDVWHKKFVQTDGITHTYNPACPYDNMLKGTPKYDNAPPPGYSGWNHDCSHTTGRAGGTTVLVSARRQDGSQTLPTARTRTRPSLVNTFAATIETPFEDHHVREKAMNESSSTLRGREDSIGLSHSPQLNSRDPSVGFACSTLGRSTSPETLSSATPTGRAPLAMPEELTGSTSTSILSSSISPERDVSRLLSSDNSANTSSTPQADDDPLASKDRSSTDFSLSTLTVNYSDGPPSPDSSRNKIFNALCSNLELSDKLTHSKHFPLSPSATECSSGTMASSCSLPMVSQISTTPPSDSSFYKLYHQNSAETSPSAGVKMRPDWDAMVSARPLERESSKGSENQSINELDEWRKIDDIMSSFGGAVCRESVFAANYEPQVAVFLRDRRSQALTLQLTSPSSAAATRCTVNSTSSTYKFEPDYVNMSQWLCTCVGIPNSKANEVARILTKAGFDKTTQLDGCLTSREMTALGIERHIQQQILNYLATTVKIVRPNANNFNYVSDWLCSLELTDYLGNFVTAGLKSMLIVRTADLTRDHLEKMGITQPGHIARILQSLMEAKIEDACERTERLEEMRRAVTSNTSTSNVLKAAPLEESTTFETDLEGETVTRCDLLHGHASFSAHYLGSMEISNVDGTEESRRAMAKLKKSIREIAKVPQVFLEISIHGVRILDGKNGQLAVEHEISHIQIVCQDERDLNCFTYISQDAEKNLCHVFCVLTADVATEIIVTLGQAFELAYKLQSGQAPEEVANV